MTEDADLANIPQASRAPKRRAKLSVVWIIPVVAALVALGIAVQRILTEGPTVTITFRAAEGLEAGKTFVKYRDVNIGQVTAVRLTDDFTRVLVTAKIDKHAEPLLVEDARFWVVQPRVTLSGISGIGTLLAGNYIGFEPGKSGKERRRFEGLETPPIITGGLPGREFVLRADTLGSVGIGSPLYYRHLNVGQVVAYELAGDGKSLDIRVFVHSPYDRYVTTNARFWNASGVDVSVGAGGVTVRTESVVSVLIGGIAFETPDYLPPGEPAVASTVFPLHHDRATGLARRQTDVLAFTLLFDESVQGLSPGAPVTFLGLQIGEVAEIGLERQRSAQHARPRVEIVTYPERMFQRLRQPEAARARGMTREERRAAMDRFAAHGMRAQLRLGSLLSGQMYVAFDYFPDARKAKIDWTREPPGMPTVPRKAVDLEAKLNGILAKLDKVPFDAIGKNAEKTLASLDRTLADAGRTLSRVEAETLPGATRALEDVRRAAAAAERVLGSTDNTLLGPDAPAQQEMRDALREVARAARAIRLLADALEQNPESLLRGKSKESP